MAGSALTSHAALVRALALALVLMYDDVPPPVVLMLQLPLPNATGQDVLEPALFNAALYRRGQGNRVLRFRGQIGGLDGMGLDCLA